MVTRSNNTRRLVRTAPLTLSQRVERLEKTLLFKPAAVKVPEERPRFTKVGVDGRPTQGAHVAVYDAKTNLTWAAGPMGAGKIYRHADSLKASADCRIAKVTDWRAPEVWELLSIIDYTKHDPAVDQDLFQGPFAFTWTSTPYAADPGCAWGVSLYNGLSGWVHHSAEYRARAVRAGQTWAIGG